MRFSSRFSLTLFSFALLSIFIFLWIGAAVSTAQQAGSCPNISILACNEVKLLPPQQFDFDGADGGLADAHNVGIGFTMVDPPTTPGNPNPITDAPGYWPNKLVIANGHLAITTTDGINARESNNHDNLLGIGLDVSNPVAIQTTLVNMPPAPGSYAQAGLWFGLSTIGPNGLKGTGTLRMITSNSLSPPILWACGL